MPRYCKPQQLASPQSPKIERTIMLNTEISVFWIDEGHMLYPHVSVGRVIKRLVQLQSMRHRIAALLFDGV